MFRFAISVLVLVAAAALVDATESPRASHASVGSSHFSGFACLNGSCGEEINGSEVVAKIGGVECGSTVADYYDGWEGQEVGFYEINVVSAQHTPGCGTPGATVEFYIAGVQASQTGIWGFGAEETVNLMAGGDFAAFSGSMQCGEACECHAIYCFFPPVRAFIDGVQCGFNRTEGYLFYGGAYVLLAVKSANQQDGCGTEGAKINFTVGGRPANETGTWTAGFHRLDLTASPEIAWGDIDCSGQITPIDSLRVLKADAGELHPSVVADCPWPDDQVLAEGIERTWADVDCSGGDPLEAMNPVDALKLLMADAGLAASQPAGCPAIGVPVGIEDP